MSWGINFGAKTCGACLRTRASAGNIFEELFSAYLPNFGGNSFWCKYMPRLYLHPREYCYYEKIPGELFMTMVWCQGGMLKGKEIAGRFLQFPGCSFECLVWF